ncbi:MAG: hypothetical protein BM557_06405 [Flavobacterium sp. MedPE-SWcel]|nr:MAG: hypothetical protein BM557_06405 [Flavobacterium sp. MedPE-SWcel]
MCFYGQDSGGLKPEVIEGYIVDSCFYERQGDKCLGREGIEYANKIKNKDLLKVLDTTSRLYRGVYVKFKAVRATKPRNKKPCICNTKLLVNEVLEVDVNHTLLGDLFTEKSIKSYGKREYVEIDGFFINEFEGMFYYEKRGDKLLYPMWHDVTEELKSNDDLTPIIWFPHGPGGIRMKVGGTKYSEAPFNFGHGVGVPYKIEISKIIDVDTTYTLHDFYVEKYRERGYHLTTKGDTIVAYEDFKVGKVYKFKGIEYIDEYDYSEVDQDTTTNYQNIKPKEDYTEDEIIRYAVTIKATDAITIEVTVKRLDNTRELKTTTLISRWFYRPYEEWESFYASKEYRSEYTPPVSFLYIDKKPDESGKRLGHFHIELDGWKSAIDIKEE